MNRISSFTLTMHRFGLRRQLMLALGFLCLLLLLALGTQLARLLTVADLARTAVAVEGRLSTLADNIAVQTLLCRRFEKDFLLTIDNPELRSDYFSRWQRTHADLGAAIEAFAATTSGDRYQQQIESWREGWRRYGDAMLDLEARVASGELTTPQAANTALDPQKASIRTLTDSAVAVAAEKVALAELAGRRLEEQLTLSLWLGAGLGAVALAVALGWVFWFPAQLLRPIAALHGAVVRMAEGDLTARTGVVRADELGDLARGFDAMAAQIAERTEELTHQYAQAEAARHAADVARRLADEQLATINEQREVIRELSVPLLPLSDRALVMPLVGALDSSRLLLSQERALAALSQSGLRHLILDVTGVPVIDTQVAKGLMQLASAARLLGTEVTVVGVQPEVAQTLVGLGLVFQNLRFKSTLQEAVRVILT